MAFPVVILDFTCWDGLLETIGGGIEIDTLFYSIYFLHFYQSARRYSSPYSMNGMWHHFFLALRQLNTQHFLEPVCLRQVGLM